MIPRPTKITAVLNGDTFEHFGINKVTATMYGNQPDDIITVELTVAEDQTIPPQPQNDPNIKDNDYWAWWEFEENNYTLVWHKRFLLNMCFPYGIQLTEEKNKGKAYRVNVKQV